MTYDEFKQDIEAKWLAAQHDGSLAKERIYGAVLFRLVKRLCRALASITQLAETNSDPGRREQCARSVRRLAQLPEIWG